MCIGGEAVSGLFFLLREATISVSSISQSVDSLTSMAYSPDGIGEHLLTVEEEESGGGDPKSKFLVCNLSKKSDAGVTILNGVNLDVPEGLVVGMLFQIPALFEGTVADNIRYRPQLRGKKLTDNEVHKLLTLAELDPSFYKKNGNELSVGQAQRVALARTLANEPEVLLLDEPTSALDPISTQNIEDVIVKLKKSQGMTIVMVSHSIKQIQRVADIVCLLVNGEVVEVLKPDELSEGKHPMAQRFLQLS